MNEIPELIAHRGAMRDYPENTLPALEAALDAGARYLEFDVQFSGDGIPMLLHDDTLDRTTGVSGSVFDHSADALTRTSAHVPDLFGDRFQGTCIPRLDEAVTMLNRRSDVVAFVEIKRQSLMRFGVEECIDAIERVMKDAQFEWTLISFIQDALEYGRRHHHRRIGWVLREYNLTARRIAEIMRPEFLFCKLEKLNLPLQQLWPGDWQWVVYDVTDMNTARQLRTAGADFIETGAIAALCEEQDLTA